MLFLLAKQKRKQPDKSSGESDSGGEEKSKQNVPAASPAGTTAPSSSYCDNDVGHWLGRSFSMTSTQKIEI